MGSPGELAQVVRSQHPLPQLNYLMMCYHKHSSPTFLQENTVIIAEFQPCLPVCHAASLLAWRMRPLISKFRSSQFRPSPCPLQHQLHLGNREGNRDTCQIEVRCLPPDEKNDCRSNNKGNLEKGAEMDMLNEM